MNKVQFISALWIEWGISFNELDALSILQPGFILVAAKNDGNIKTFTKDNDFLFQCGTNIALLHGSTLFFLWLEYVWWRWSISAVRATDCVSQKRRLLSYLDSVADRAISRLPMQSYSSLHHTKNMLNWSDFPDIIVYHRFLYTWIMVEASEANQIQHVQFKCPLQLKTESNIR